MIDTMSPEAYRRYKSIHMRPRRRSRKKCESTLQKLKSSQLMPIDPKHGEQYYKPHAINAPAGLYTVKDVYRFNFKTYIEFKELPNEVHDWETIKSHNKEVICQPKCTQ